MKQTTGMLISMGMITIAFGCIPAMMECVASFDAATTQSAVEGLYGWWTFLLGASQLACVVGSAIVFGVAMSRGKP